jgi:chemotaxis protein MotA
MTLFKTPDNLAEFSVVFANYFSISLFFPVPFVHINHAVCPDDIELSAWKMVYADRKKEKNLGESRAMDIATVLGFILGLTCIIGTMLYEGGLGIFINIPAFAIVFGGMGCATMIHFSMKQFLGIFSVIKKTLFHKIADSNEVIKQMVNYAVINRRDGALSLEQEIAKIRDPFLAKGLQMLVDGQEESIIHERMSMEIQYTQERHGMGRKILEFMGSSAPSFAMVGTLIGLVNMLSDMEDPSKIGRGMATALVCTFCSQYVFIAYGRQARTVFQIRDTSHGNDTGGGLCNSQG